MNMELKENLGLILIIIGLLISLTMVLAWIGVPIAAIGTYLLYKKVNNQEENISEELQEKKEYACLCATERQSWQSHQ